MPTTASIHSFSGDSDFSARESITLCEDVIKGSSLTEDADKISLIHSRLVPGSWALNLIQSSAFTLTDISSVYEQSKWNFQRVFRDGGREL